MAMMNRVLENKEAEFSSSPILTEINNTLALFFSGVALAVASVNIKNYFIVCSITVSNSEKYNKL